jgi:excisionase family DNA binding protein
MSTAVRQPLLTTRQVAELLAVSPATVLRRARAGEIPSFRIASNALRFSAAEIAAWLEERRSAQ